MSREPEGVKITEPFDLLSAMICIAALKLLIKESSEKRTCAIAGGAFLGTDDVINHLKSGIDLLNKIQSGNVFIFSDKETSK